MHSFLKLSTGLINKSFIVCIRKYPKKYEIQLHISKFSGLFSGASGFISSYPNLVDVDQTTNPMDYKIVDEFVKKYK